MNKLPKHVVREVDRHGNERYYFRDGHHGPRIRIYAKPGTRDFQEAYDLAANHGLRIGKEGIPRKPKSVVYFFTNGRKVKIGVSSNVAQRIASLRTATPGRSCLYYTTPGDTRLERLLHSMFENDRMNGEWFRFSPAIRQWIDEDERYRKTLKKRTPALTKRRTGDTPPEPAPANA